MHPTQLDARLGRRHLTVEPITADDDTIAAYLQQLSVPALIAAVVQITGDPCWLRGPARPREFVQNEFQGKMTAAELAELRAGALRAITFWRDAGCPPTEPPGPELTREIIDWIACEPVAEDYAELYAEEMDLAGDNPRAIGLTPGEVPAGFSVLIIGLGEAGLLAALRLQEAGIPFEIFEKNDDVGGTWYENSYPGCRVDVASHFYSYSFTHADQFSDYYARQPELHRYFRGLLDEFGIAEHVRWGHEVTRARWDEDTATWQVSAVGPGGRIETRCAPVLLAGVGFLNRPLIPDLPNLESFAGPVFHAARWDHSVDLAGKRVALVGAGASGFQIGPAIVDEVAELTVFQRTPQWMAPNPRYHAAVGEGERWAMRSLPGYSRWYRFMLMLQSSDKMLELVRAQEDWPDFPRTANAASAARRAVFADWIADQLADDPQLADRVTPDYPPMAKRMLQDNGSWLRCLKRPHVQLVSETIRDIDAGGIVTDSGRHDADVLVLATGFRASEVLAPMEIIGRDGLSIGEVWDGKPAAYNGISVPGFPNLFIFSGPGTGLAHAGSVMFMTECQMRYVGAALRTLIENGHRSIEPTEAAYTRYRDALQAEVATLMWGHPSIEHSWYKAADGNVYVLSPWRSVDYWRMTRGIDPADHQLT